MNGQPMTCSVIKRNKLYYLLLLSLLSRPVIGNVALYVAKKSVNSLHTGP